MHNILKRQEIPRFLTRGQYANIEYRMECGGDLWNRANIFRYAFRNPEIDSVEIDYMGTGLWCTVNVTTPFGRRRLTVYDAGHSRYE